MHQPRGSLVSCAKDFGLYQGLSQKKLVVQETWTCTHFWILWFRLCWWPRRHEVYYWIL